MVERRSEGNRTLPGEDHHQHVVFPHVARDALQLVSSVGLHIFRADGLMISLQVTAQDADGVGMGMVGDAATQRHSQAGHVLHPMVEAGLELRLSRNGHVDAPDGVHRHRAAYHRDLPVQAVEQADQHRPEEELRGGALHVEPHHELGIVVLLHAVDDAVGQVRGQPHLRAHLHIGRRSDGRSRLEQFHALLAGLLVVVEHHVDGAHRLFGLVFPHQQGDVDQIVHRVGIGQGNQRGLLVQRAPLVDGAVLQSQLPGRHFGDERTDHARDEYQQDRPVQHVLVQQALTRGQDDVVAHQHRGQRGRRLRVAQAVHEFTLQHRHPEYLLRHPCGNPLARKGHRDHHGRHLQRLARAQQHAHVDDHPHPDEEIGNEEGIAHELQMMHQRSAPGNKAVEHQAGQESSKDAFHPDEFHQPGAQEHHAQHEYELKDRVVVAAEEAAGYAGEGINNEKGQEHELRQQEGHVPTAESFFAEHARNEGQHQERQRVGHNRAAHGDAHAAVARHTVTNHDGIGYQGVGGVHAGQQHRGHQTVFQQEHVAHHAHSQRDDEGRKPQRQRLPADALHVLHVHLQAGEEHDVVQPHVAEKLETAVAVEHVQPVRSDEHASQNHAYNMRDAQLPQQYGRKQDDAQYQKEYPSGIRYGKICRQIGHLHERL